MNIVNINRCRRTLDMYETETLDATIFMDIFRYYLVAMECIQAFIENRFNKNDNDISFISTRLKGIDFGLFGVCMWLLLQTG